MHELTACNVEPWHTKAGIESELAFQAGTWLALARPHASASSILEPLDLLRAERCALPLLGRAEELALLECWVASAAPLSIRRLVGRAGTGKTRLAIELCRRAEAQGWSAGFATIETIAQVGAEPLRPWHKDASLVIIDRIEAYDELSAECCVRLARSRQEGRKLRLLLLEREPTGRALRCPAFACADTSPDLAEPVHLAGLRAPADRRALVSQAMALAARLAGLPACSPPASAALDSAEPLHLLMAALVAPHQGIPAALARSTAALADELAAAERMRLEQFAYRQQLHPVLVRHLVACITLQAGCSLGAAPGLVHQEAAAMGMHLPEPAEHVADCLADTLLAADDNTLAPLGPAPIGEAFLVQELMRHAPEQQAAIIERALHRAHTATAAMLRRVAELHSDNNSTHPARAWSCQAGV